ncbi:MAG: 5-oxoprolinase subunit C family protein [Chloroflexota bacterium]
MSLEILEPGFLTTIQDIGRFGYQRWGIPTAGAMDPFALKAANALVGNPPTAAGLEITLQGPRIRFAEGCAIAVTGGDLGARLDGWELEGWRRRLVSPGSVLDFAGRRSGARAYLAVSGGIAVEPWLGSRATYLLAAVGGLEGRALRAGDLLPIGPATLTPARPSVPPGRRPHYSGEPTVRVVLGPHADRFTDEGIESFLSGGYQVTPTSNRMGYRLEGPRIAHTRGPDLISCGIPLGGIQVPGSGQPIILMADHQTAGGYTMIATVIQADIPLVAQLLPGERVRFEAVSLEEARDSLRRLEEGLRASIEETEANPW